MSPASTANVLLVTFGEDPENDSNAYRALTDLNELSSQGQIAVEAATVITRDLDGNVIVKDQVGENPWEGTAAGGLLGVLLGVLAGPLGMLLGGSTGVLVGSLVDVDEVETTQSVLAEYATKVHPTRTAVLVEATEQSPEVVDTAMAKLGGEVTRRSVYEVKSELDAAEAAERKANREARKELHKARAEQRKADVQAKGEELKDKLSRP
jgi:uncharacterized membrane protein